MDTAFDCCFRRTQVPRTQVLRPEEDSVKQAFYCLSFLEAADHRLFDNKSKGLLV
jgi:hypothetical protein